MKTKLLLLFVTMAILLAPAVHAQVPPRLQKTFKTFCFDCHDNASNQAKLSLESLLKEPDSRTSAATWTRVHDKLAAHEMPPADTTQPNQEQRRELTDWLHQELHTLSLQQQQRDGRVSLRRMNITEYEQDIYSRRKWELWRRRFVEIY